MDNGKREYRLATVMIILSSDPFSPQNGQGEHVWFMNTMGGDNSQVRTSLRTSHYKPHPSPQYPLSNRYNGQWVEGVREGQGTFHYAR